jgi:glyoxylase-like metal-dependent hydrolase (beta-lactamase superfamily II)
MTSRNQWETLVLQGGAFRLDGGSMFGIIPKEIWSAWTVPDEHNRIGLNCNLALLRDGESVVLVEAGYGDKFSEKERAIFAMTERTPVDALREAGIEPEEITHVILSHLHFDHAGALSRWADPNKGNEGGFVPTFPNATIVSQRQEWEDANANRSTMTKSYLKSHLDPVADSVLLADGEGEPLPGIKVECMPGHTWGQQAVLWSDTDREYVFPGDVCPTAAHVHPSANMGFDVEPWTNMNRKAELLAACARSGRSILLAHEPGNPLVDVVESTSHEGRFEFVPSDAAR